MLGLLDIIAFLVTPGGEKVENKLKLKLCTEK